MPRMALTTYCDSSEHPEPAQVDHDEKDNKSLLAFNELWKSQFQKDCLLVFSTGRSLKLYNELRVCLWPSWSPSACKMMLASYCVNVGGRCSAVCLFSSVYPAVQ